MMGAGGAGCNRTLCKHEPGVVGVGKGKGKRGTKKTAFYTSSIF